MKSLKKHTREARLEHGRGRPWQSWQSRGRRARWGSCGPPCVPHRQVSRKKLKFTLKAEEPSPSSSCNFVHVFIPGILVPGNNTSKYEHIIPGTGIILPMYTNVRREAVTELTKNKTKTTWYISGTWYLVLITRVLQYYVFLFVFFNVPQTERTGSADRGESAPRNLHGRRRLRSLLLH